MRSPVDIAALQESGHHKYLPDLKLDLRRIRLSSNIDDIVSECDNLLFVTPSAYFMPAVASISVSLEDQNILTAIKGFVGPERQTVAEFFNSKYNIPFDQICVISGPCHAEEIAIRKLTVMTVSSKEKSLAKMVGKMLECSSVRVVHGSDVYGAEYAAAVKNVYAIAVGMCLGMGYGDNFIAVLVSSCLNEMNIFLDLTHQDANRQITHSAYAGDLLVTCYSQFSRNRRFGTMLGQGYTAQEAMDQMKMVAEGYYACNAVHRLSRELGVGMPLVEVVYDVLYRNQAPSDVIKRLENSLK